MTQREELLTQTFVQLADTLVDDFDIIDLLTVLADRCVELVDAAAAGVLLADDRGRLRVVAASSEQARLLELFQLQNEEGPCLEAYATGEPMIHTDLRTAADRWPRFASEAVDSGFGSVYAFPLKLRSTVIGALNLFRAESNVLVADDVRLVQALADVASIAILQDQGMRESHIRSGQLQHALDSRITIEQAKGILAERAHVDMDKAFDLLRSYARSANRQLTAVATDLIAGNLPADRVASRPPAHRPQ